MRVTCFLAPTKNSLGNKYLVMSTSTKYKKPRDRVSYFVSGQHIYASVVNRLHCLSIKQLGRVCCACTAVSHAPVKRWDDTVM